MLSWQHQASIYVVCNIMIIYSAGLLLGVKGTATVSNHIIEVEHYLGIEAVR